jgi:hypothetical protein
MKVADYVVLCVMLKRSLYNNEYLYTVFFNYETENMLIKSRRPRLVQLLRWANTKSYKENCDYKSDGFDSNVVVECWRVLTQIPVGLASGFWESTEIMLPNFPRLFSPVSYVVIYSSLNNHSTLRNLSY